MTTTVRIRLLWHKQAQFAGYLLAEKLDLARKHGVKIACEGLDFSCKHVASILTGTTPMAVASPAHILESSDPGALRWVLTIQQESPLIYPVRKIDGINSLADFAGRKVGVWPGHEDLEFRWMLQKSGVPAGAVERIAMPDTVVPFLEGEIASAQMTNYHELHLVEDALGADAVSVFSGRETGCSILKDGLVVSAGYAETNPQVVQAVVDAVLEGWTIAFREPERAVAVCMEARPGISQAEHRRQLADIRALALCGATLTDGLGYPDPMHVEQAARALLEVESKVVDANTALDQSYWLAAPEAYRRKVWK